MSQPTPTINRRDLLAAATAVATTAVPLAHAAAMTSDSADHSTNIWDAHGHLVGLVGSPEQRVDRILDHADRLGIERLMLCMGLKFNADPTPTEMKADNDAVLRAIRHAPRRTFGFVYLNPKHVVASLEELDRCVARGPMVGIKLWITVRCNHPDLDGIVRRAHQLSVPILQHVYQRTEKNRPGESLPTDLAELAARHPSATFIAAHTGNDWEQGIRAIRPHPNVYAEVCGSDATAGMVEMVLQDLEREAQASFSLIVTGGDAGRVAAQLARRAILAPDLVLQGLAVMI